MTRGPGSHAGEVRWGAAAVCLAAGFGVGCAYSWVFAAGVVALAVLLFTALLWPQYVVATLLMGGLLLSRPTIPGGAFQTEGIVLAVLAAFVALIHRRHWARPSRAARRLLFWVSLLWLWTVALSLAHPYYPLSDTLKGAVAVVVVVGAAAVVCAEPTTERRVIRLFVAITGLLCASAVVTYAVWITRGVGTLHLGQVPNYAYSANVDLSAPFTLSTAQQKVLGLVLPRFLGICREPGLMQGLIIASYFLMDRVDWQRRWWLKLVLVAGLLATLSTAGIAAFVIAWLLRFALGGGLRQQGRPLTVGRLVFLAAALAAGAWAVINLPFLGLDAKNEVNVASVNDRYNNGLRGLSNLWTAPIGGIKVLDPNSGINLVAAISTIGAVGFLLAAAAFWLPVLRSTQRRLAIVVVTPLFITTLLAQPTLDSPLWWVLALLAVGVASDPGQPEPDEGGALAGVGVGHGGHLSSLSGRGA